MQSRSARLRTHIQALAGLARQLDPAYQTRLLALMDDMALQLAELEREPPACAAVSAPPAGSGG